MRHGTLVLQPLIGLDRKPSIIPPAVPMGSARGAILLRREPRFPSGAAP
jgi:hypothetical protein